MTAITAAISIGIGSISCSTDRSDDGPSSDGGEISLVIPAGNSGLKETVAAVLGQEFTDKTGIKVTVDTGTNTYNDVDQRILADRTSGTLPDVVMVGYNSVQGYAQAGIAQPLDELLSVGQETVDELYPAYRALGQVDGKTYALPQTATFLHLYYNADLFMKAGLDPERPPTTFSELRAASEQIVQSGAAKHGVAWRSSDSTSSWPLQNMVLSAGGNLVADGKPNFDTDEALSVVDFWSKLQADGLAISGKGDEMAQQFLQADTAMIVYTSSVMDNWLKTVSFPIRIAPAPVADGGESKQLVFGGALMVMTEDRGKQAAAVQVIDALIGQEGQAVQIENSGYASVNRAAVESGTLKGFVGGDPLRAEIASWVTDVVPWHQIDSVNPQESWTKLDQEVDQSLRGEKSAQDALRDAQAEATAVMR